MKNITKVFVGLAVSAFSVGPLQAAFQMRPVSARSAALGSSFSASSRDSGSLFTNPAGIASLSQAELSVTYGKPFAGLPGTNMNLGHAALVIPTPAGRLGLGYALYQAQDLLQEQTVAVSYGVSPLKGVRLGGTVKHLSHSYLIGSDPLAAQDPVFRNGTSRSAVAFDAGVSVSLGRHLSLGAAGRNLNEPNVGLVSEDKVTREIQAGVDLDLTGMGLKASSDLLLRQVQPGSSGPVPAFGLEKSLGQALALRAGANPEEFTAGFGLKIRSLGFDYAFLFNKNLSEDNSGSHKVGLTYRFTRGK
jgi:hypothetical protein